MFIPLKTSIYELEIEKSKFISLSIPVDDVIKVKDIINNIKKEYPKARHYLYAYKINGVTKSNDDNEPGSIAKGFIDLLNKKDINNVIVIVIRYFGGIKLGASRLLRTYIKSANESINNLELGEMKEVYVYSLDVTYSSFNKLKSLGYKIENIKYFDTIKLDIISTRNIINDLKQFTTNEIIVNKVSRLVK